MLRIGNRPHGANEEIKLLLSCNPKNGRLPKRLPTSVAEAAQNRSGAGISYLLELADAILGEGSPPGENHGLFGKWMRDLGRLGAIKCMGALRHNEHVSRCTFPFLGRIHGREKFPSLCAILAMGCSICRHLEKSTRKVSERILGKKFLVF